MNDASASRPVPSLVLSVLAASAGPEPLRAVAPLLVGADVAVLRSVAAAMDRTGVAEALWRDVVSLMPVDVAASWFSRFGTVSDVPDVVGSGDLGRFAALFASSRPFRSADAGVWDALAARFSTVAEFTSVLSACMRDHRTGDPMPYPVRAVLRRVSDAKMLSSVFVAVPQVVGFAAEVLPAAVFLDALDAADLTAQPPARAWSYAPNAAAMDVVISDAASVDSSVTADRAAALAVADPGALWSRLEDLVAAVTAAHGCSAGARVRDVLDPPVGLGAASDAPSRCSVVLEELRSDRPPAVSAVLAGLGRHGAAGVPHVSAAVAFYAGGSHPSVPLTSVFSDVLRSSLAPVAQMFVSGMLSCAPRPACQVAQIAVAPPVRSSVGVAFRPVVELLAPVTVGGRDALTAAVLNALAPNMALDALVGLGVEGLLDDAVIAGLRSTIVFSSGDLLSPLLPGEHQDLSSPRFLAAQHLSRWLVDNIGVHRLVLAAGLASDALTLAELAEVVNAATGPDGFLSDS